MSRLSRNYLIKSLAELKELLSQEEIESSFAKYERNLAAVSPTLETLGHGSWALTAAEIYSRFGASVASRRFITKLGDWSKSATSQPADKSSAFHLIDQARQARGQDAVAQPKDVDTARAEFAAAAHLSVVLGKRKRNVPRILPSPSRSPPKRLGNGLACVQCRERHTRCEKDRGKVCTGDDEEKRRESVDSDVEVGRGAVSELANDERADACTIIAESVIDSELVDECGFAGEDSEDADISMNGCSDIATRIQPLELPRALNTAGERDDDNNAASENHADVTFDNSADKRNLSVDSASLHSDNSMLEPNPFDHRETFSDSDGPASGLSLPPLMDFNDKPFASPYASFHADDAVPERTSLLPDSRTKDQNTVERCNANPDSEGAAQLSAPLPPDVVQESPVLKTFNTSFVSVHQRDKRSQTTTAACTASKIEAPTAPTPQFAGRLASNSPDLGLAMDGSSDDGPNDNQLDTKGPNVSISNIDGSNNDGSNADASNNNILSSIVPTMSRDLQEVFASQLAPGKWLGHDVIENVLKAASQLNIAFHDPGNLEKLQDLYKWPAQRSPRHFRQDRVAVILNVPLPVQDIAGKRLAHWVVFCFTRSSRQFIVLDSLNSLTLPLEGIGRQVGSSIMPGPDPWVYSATSVPQQQNGYDCGIFAVVSTFLLVINHSIHKHLSIVAPALWRYIFQTFLGGTREEAVLKRWIKDYLSGSQNGQAVNCMLQQASLVEMRDAVQKAERLKQSQGNIAAFIQQATEIVQICNELVRVAEEHIKTCRKMAAEHQQWKQFAEDMLAKSTDHSGFARTMLEQTRPKLHDVRWKANADKSQQWSIALRGVADQILACANKIQEETEDEVRLAKKRVNELWVEMQEATKEIGQWIEENK